MDIERALLRRIWAKIQITNSCWIWTANRTGGYGQVRAFGKSLPAHRVVYELLVADIPEGYQLDHLCKNVYCVNPNHLEVVTPRENVLRSDSPTAKNARKTHCKNGHEFTEENTYYYGKGYRACRLCKREKEKNYSAVKKERRRLARGH